MPSALPVEAVAETVLYASLFAFAFEFSSPRLYDSREALVIHNIIYTFPSNCPCYYANDPGVGR